MPDQLITALVEPGENGRLGWLAADPAGHPVGSAHLRLPAGAPGQAELDLAVHPAHRRRGTGTALLGAAVEAARSAGCRCLLSQVRAESAGERFLAARGFRRVLRLHYTRLAVADVDRTAVAAAVAAPHPGYRLVCWPGLVPDELLDTFVASRRAMDDMPMEDADDDAEPWDADRVRAAVRAVAERGEHLDTVTVVADATGEIVGFTELVVPADGAGDAQHYGTGVLPEHRGHGLAGWMKAAALDRAVRRYPRLAGLLADTAASNAPMRRVNERLGYRPTHVDHRYQLDL